MIDERYGFTFLFYFVCFQQDNIKMFIQIMPVAHDDFLGPHFININRMKSFDKIKSMRHQQITHTF